MTYFTFDRTWLDDLPADVSEQAELAVSTAEKLAGYYQAYAKALFIGIPTPERTDLSPAEAAIAKEFEVEENRFRTPSSTTSPTALLAFKIFSAAQADFYYKNPDYIVVFGSGGQALPLIVTFLKSATSKNNEAFGSAFSDLVDTYFTSSTGRLAKYVNDLYSDSDDPDYGPSFSP